MFLWIKIGPGFIVSLEHSLITLHGGLLTHHLGGRHGDVEASGDDFSLRQGAGKSFINMDIRFLLVTVLL